MLGNANSIAGRDRAGLSARGWSARCAVWARAEKFYISLHSSCIRSFPINHVQRCLAMWVHFLLHLLLLFFFFFFFGGIITLILLAIAFSLIILSFHLLFYCFIYFILYHTIYCCCCFCIFCCYYVDFYVLIDCTCYVLATIVPTSETVKETSLCSLLTLYNLPERKNSCILPHEFCANRLNITFSLFPRCDSADIWTAHLLVRVMSGGCNRLIYNTTYILVKI